MAMELLSTYYKNFRSLPLGRTVASPWSFQENIMVPVFIAYFSFVEGLGGFATLMSFIPPKDTLSYDG